MREDLTERFTGTPILDWIEDIHYAIMDDHVSLWGLLSDANAFGLDANERVEFVRRCLRSIFDAGAVPVVFTGKVTPIFERTDRFGTTRDEIVEAVIADWLASGGSDLEWGAYPFTYQANFDPYGWKDETISGKLSGREKMWLDLGRKAEEQGH
jgi:hypothetical protein